MDSVVDKTKLLAKAEANLKRTAKIANAIGPVRENVPATSPSGAREIHMAVSGVPGEKPSVTAVKKILKNKVYSAVVLSELIYQSAEVMPVADICTVLREQGETAAGGDLSNLQSMLAVQAILLDAIFTEFSRRAALSKNNDDLERMLRIALKAQSQSRTSVESLAVIQQGPTIFARNANVNNGQQQVNNGVPAPAGSTPTVPRTRARKAKVAQQTIQKVAA